MAKELLKRSEVKTENTWKVEDMYADVDAWKADLETVKKLAEELETYQGRMGESAETLYRAMFLDDESDVSEEWLTVMPAVARM